MEKKVYRCLIASPSDTQKEREICDVVFDDINRTLGEAYSFTLESLKWEKDIYPALGEDGQDVINKQIDGKYNMFIGMMYARYGSKTKRADSGTEEEFYKALKIAKEHDTKDFNVMFYFNVEPIPSNTDPTQLRKVKKFKESAKKEGLYWEYNGASQFADVLKNHLIQYFHSIYDPVKISFKAIQDSINNNSRFGFENLFIHTLLTIEDDNNYSYEVFRTIKLIREINFINIRPTFHDKCTISLYSSLADIPSSIECDEVGNCHFSYPLPNNRIGSIITVHYVARVPLRSLGYLQMSSENDSITEIHDVILKNEIPDHPGELYMRPLTCLPDDKGKLIKRIPFDSHNKLYRIVLEKPEKGTNYIFYW